MISCLLVSAISSWPRCLLWLRFLTYGCLSMTKSLLPRYLRVAHWMHEQQQFFSSENIVRQFNLPPKRVSDDFSVIREMGNIIELDEIKERRSGKLWRLIKVTFIHDYVLDARNYPHRIGERQYSKSEIIASTWHVLLSTRLRRDSLLHIIRKLR
jgi:hypothetical protein